MHERERNLAVVHVAQVARSAVVTGTRAARSAGSSSADEPHRECPDHADPGEPGVTSSRKLKPKGLTAIRWKRAQARSTPRSAPGQREQDRLAEDGSDNRRVGTNPMARSVAISRRRESTIEYSEFTAPSVAPTAMIEPTK